MLQDSSRPSVGDYRRFPVFAFIWAVTTLVHQLAFTFWTESWQGWILVLATFAVIYQPSCVLRFGAMVFASLLNLWHKLPFVPNHILYEGMLHVIMLIAMSGYFLADPGRSQLRAVVIGWRSRLLPAIVAVLLKTLYFCVPGVPQGPLLGAATTLVLVVAIWRLLFRSPPLTPGDDYLDRFAPIIRVAVGIMYLWAVIQKLNWDYFNIDVSCAAQLHREIAVYFGGLVPTAPWMLKLTAPGSLVFELGIPLLLFFRRTRLAGFAVAIGFHLWLSIHPAAGIFSFTSLILAILVFFLPSTWGVQLQGLWDRQLRWLGRGEIERGRHRARGLVLGGFFITLFIQIGLYLTIERSYAVFFKANRIGFFTFFAWGCWIGACFLIAGWKAGRADRTLPNRGRWNLAWVGLIPIILNGVFPWLGGRTQTSFSMYSNLRSEAEGNHMFLKRIDLFNLQTDMIDVVESAPNILGPSKRPRGIQQFANVGHHIIPWFEFRRLVSEMPDDFEVTYRRHGKELSLGRRNGEIHGDLEAFQPLPLLQRKFIWFRRLESLDGPMCCTH